MEKEKKVFTTYKQAVKWLGSNIVLCNNIPQLDEFIWDNFEKNIFDDEGNPTEIFQWFITDCSQDDVNWLSKNFDLIFTYSEKLDCYILAVGHYGTSWDYVPCEVFGDMKESIIRQKKTYEDLTNEK